MLHLHVRLIRASLIGVVLLAPAIASAHIGITLPDGRSDATGLQVGPCGGVARGAGAPATVYEPGETIMVGWEETIDHPGTWRIAFSPAGDVGFDDYVLLEGPDHPGTGSYLETVTLPMMECEDCTLQVYQWMDPKHHPPPDYYYACADIILRAAGGEDAGGGVDAGDPGDDAGSPGTDAGMVRRDSGTRGGTMEEGGCGCSVPGARSRPVAALGASSLLALVALIVVRRRRRR